MDLKSGLVGSSGRPEIPRSENQARAGRDPRLGPKAASCKIFGEAAGRKSSKKVGGQFFYGGGSSKERQPETQRPEITTPGARPEGGQMLDPGFKANGRKVVPEEVSKMVMRRYGWCLKC